MNLSSGSPYWLIKSGLPYTYPKLDKSLDTEICILGGGISGALVCYYLTEAGFDCTLVDARTIGLGSTIASTALLQYEIDVPLHKLIELVGEHNAVKSYNLCLEAIDKIKKIADKLKFKDFDYKKSLYYAAYKKDLTYILKEYQVRKAHKINVSLLENKDILNDYGFEGQLGILSEKGAQVNPYLLTHSLLQYCKNKGTNIFDRTNIIKIDEKSNGVTLKTEEGHTIKAKKLIYATGYESVNYVDKKIVDLNSTYAIVSEQYNAELNYWKDNALIWNTAQPYLYIRTTKDNRILVGGRDESFRNPVKRDKLLAHKAAQLESDFKKLFPHIPFKTELSWCGTFGETKDGLPFIGKYPKLKNSYFALGFGGNGIVFSQIAAEILRDILLGKSNKDQEIFSFGRVK